MSWIRRNLGSAGNTTWSMLSAGDIFKVEDGDCFSSKRFDIRSLLDLERIL